MLNDSNAINDFNPFVVGEFNLPGTWSAAWPYDHTAIVTDKESMFDGDEDESPICDWGVTSTTDNLRGGMTCRVPFKEPKKVACPMERDIVPRQLSDPGAWVKTKDQVSVHKKKGIPTHLILILIILLVAGVLLVKK